ncbi:MAG TPA: hypothetical protein VNF07_08570 [Acidimicrobiales bacterium]|nr:hypothetical protein [Acidimicrobiales bacterium]
MDRLTALFEQLSLPEIARILRRTVFSGVGIGVVALGVSALLSHLLVGAGIVLGLGIGLFNIRLITRSVARVNASGAERPKRILAQRTLTRLGLTTVIIIGLALASVSLGIGTAAGVALFYFALIANLVRELLRENGAVPTA